VSATSLAALPTAEPERIGRFTPTELEAALGRGEIHRVLLALPTLVGLKGKTLSAAAARRVLAEGCEMSAYLLATDADMTPDFGYPWLGYHTGDLRVAPDPATIHRAAWLPHTAIMLGDATDRAGSLLTHAPRQILRAAIARLAELGLTATVGVESEAHTYRITDEEAHWRGYRGLEREFAGRFNGDYALEHDADLQQLLDLLFTGLSDSGLELEAIKTESTPGQIEPTFRPADPLASCDRHAIFKTAARQIAKHAGMSLSFMAKPHTAHNGSGCHLHLSLTDTEGQHVFAGPDRELGKVAQQALAGCLDLLGDAALFYAGTVNSYKRFAPGVFAPTGVDWGWDDRNAALRLTGHGPNRRVECRLPGADACAYLALAALLAAVAHGIENELPLRDDPITFAEHKTPSRSLPKDLGEAAERFGSEKVRAVFGADVVEHYVHAAHAEREAFQGHVTDWEMHRGFARA
jgi:glutamine synthetase